MDSSEFYKMEYESLRDEILASQAARRGNEQLGSALIAALYGWLTTIGSKGAAPLADMVWWIAPAIAVAVAWLSNSLSDGIRKAGTYFVGVEEFVLGSNVAGPKGWHTQLAAERAEEASRKK